MKNQTDFRKTVWKPVWIRVWIKILHEKKCTGVILMVFWREWNQIITNARNTEQMVDWLTCPGLLLFSYAQKFKMLSILK